MIKISIPGHKNLNIKHLVLDYNGTLACDGDLLPDVKRLLKILSDKLQIHVLTADTFGKVKAGLKGIPCQLSILPKEHQNKSKLKYIKKLYPDHTVCIGNGRNDQLMLKKASLGIAVIQEEGAAKSTLFSTDIVCTSIISALSLLTNPMRIVATLRT